MVASPIRWPFRRRWIVVLTFASMLGWAVGASPNMHGAASPDLSGRAVTLQPTSPGRGPEDVERQVTVPIELAMANCPQVETVRSRTIFGLSVIQLSFEEGTEGYWARQRVQERLTGLDLPKSASTGLAPYISSAGEICRYELRSDGTTSIMDLRTLHDWVVIPR